MLATTTVSIEVPSSDSDEWVTLTFYTNQILAPNHEPIKIERSGRFPIAASYQEYATNALAKLRFMFYEQKCNQQIQLKTFSHKKGAAKPNESALNLALLIADLHFAGVISLPEISALEAGFCFTNGLVSINPCAVAPENQQKSELLQTNCRTSLVYRFENISPTPYQANFDYELLALVKSIAPQNIQQSCVYFPMVDSGKDGGHTLTSFTVFYMPSTTKSYSYIGNDTTFKFAVNEFVEQSIDLNVLLKGHILIDCGSRPSKGHNSWQLALVAALQIVTGVMPCSNIPLICTGQITRNDVEDNSRAVVAIGEAHKKYHFIQALHHDNTELQTVFNQQTHEQQWCFCLPEKNYYELDVDENLFIQVLPITYWYFDDLIG